MPNLLRITVLAALAVLVAPGLREMPVIAAETPDAAVPLAAEVRGLIAGLGSETRAVRVAAERRLVELGPAVLTHLPAPELLPSISVREAVRRIRLELERLQARESVLPSRVTIEQSGSLRQTLAEISKQTGNRLDGDGLPQELLRQTLDSQPVATSFWQALDDLAGRLKFRYDYDPAIRGLKLAPSDSNRPERPPVAGYAGAFRVEAPPAERIRRLAAGRGAEPARSDLVRVTLNVSAEPRLRPLFLQFAAGDFAVRSRNQVDLPPFTPEAKYELALGEGSARVQLDCLIPGGADVATISVAGKLTCTTAAGNDLIRFADLRTLQNLRETNIARRRGGVTVTLNRVQVLTATPGRHELRVSTTVNYDTGGPAFESHRTWMLHNEVFLEDPAGKPVRLNGGSQTTQQGEGGVAIEYRFVDLPDPLPDYSFVYVAPTMIIDVPIEFEIQSVAVKSRP
jgi:hypothetical protein